jgi:preprotein translocase subunit YajC
VIIGASSGSSFFLLIILAFAVLYLIVVRPQKRRQVQQKQLLEELQVGDEVLTAGGIYGTIKHIEDERVTVEIAPQLEVEVARRAIAGVTVEPEPEDDDEPEADEESEEAAEHDVEHDEGSKAETSNEENRG